MLKEGGEELAAWERKKLASTTLYGGGVGKVAGKGAWARVKQAVRTTFYNPVSEVTGGVERNPSSCFKSMERARIEEMAMRSITPNIGHYHYKDEIISRYR